MLILLIESLQDNIINIFSLLNKPANAIIEHIVSQLKDGMVIPVAVGVTGGSRDDFLYDKLDLLLVAILDAGYDIVSVSELLQE